MSKTEECNRKKDYRERKREKETISTNDYDNDIDAVSDSIRSIIWLNVNTQMHAYTNNSKDKK